MFLLENKYWKESIVYSVIWLKRLLPRKVMFSIHVGNFSTRNPCSASILSYTIYIYIYI